MTSSSSSLIPLFRMPVHQDPDVVHGRNQARLIAEKLGFDRQDQIRVATAVSEIVRNAFLYAGGGTVEFLFETRPQKSGFRNPCRLLCIVKDTGKGIPHLDAVLSGTYRSPGGMGMGITGAKRLMDALDIETGTSGTTVRIARELPRGKSLNEAQVRAIAATLMPSLPVADPLEELSLQNGDLAYMMEQVGAKNDELARVNEELSETNRGVVALYDELDTIYRVGRVLASKLELSELLQAIITATTDISYAELGVFFYEEPDRENLHLRQITAGPLSEVFEPVSATSLTTLLGPAAGNAPALRIDDLAAENSITSPLGTLLPFRSYLAIPIALSSGELTGAMVFAHRRPAEFSERSERIITSVALQASIGIENARLYKNVQSASAAKDQFLAVLSHELRNPLNPVFARLTLLEENPAMPEDALEDLHLIRRNLELETRLIDDLLDMTRIARGKISLRMEPVNLHDVITAALHACSQFAREQQITVDARLAATRFIVQGDGVRLQQVFWNLLNNAIKFSPERSSIFIRTEDAGGDTIRTTVRDSGIGIAPERMESIFLPFDQGGASVTSRFGGLGLGLAICRSIVTAHQGEIAASSEGEGQGASFVVSLHPALPETALPENTSPPERAAPGHGLHILLVDDHQDTRISLAKLLERRGHTVTTASCMAEARAAAGKIPVQLLISDIGLPDGTGYDLMRSLHSIPGLKGIAVSGYGMKEDIARSREAGFSLHLTKPLKISELEAAIAGV